jgi:hypothetical protein
MTQSPPQDHFHLDSRKKKERLTSLVLSLPTRITISLTARYTSLNSDSIPNFQIQYPFAYFNNFSGGFVACSAFVSDYHCWADVAVFPEMDIGSVER